MRNIEHNKKLLSVFVLISFAVMITVNVVANVIPLNNMTTGQISDKYENLFAPASLTFLIWGVIYLLLAKYCIYQFQFNSRRPDNNDRVVRKVNTYFVIANVVNSLWILSWHYEQIFASMILIFVLLLLLISIRINITHRSNLSKSERISIELPFSIYFGWVTVASIANVSTYLVYSNWDQLGYSESFMTIIILVIGLLISVATVLFFKDLAYGLVIIWSYGCILYKHLGSEMLNKSYKEIVITLIVCLIVLAISLIVVTLMKKPKQRRRR